MISFFKQLIDKGNALSAMRWAFVFTYLFVLISVVVVWSTICVMQGKIADIPENVWGFVSAILGIVTSGKVFQSFAERKGDES